MNPVPFTEIKAYYYEANMPHSLMAFVDLIRGIEKQQKERADKEAQRAAAEAKAAAETPTPSISR